MGHIRDLPQSSKDIPEKVKKEKWAQLGVNVDQNFEPLYCVPKDKLKVVKNLKDKLAGASELFLATDEDREGESISWHLVEVLKPKVKTQRMVFNEITKDAIQKSLKDTREIDFNLVRAQEARRVLDRLVGYTISPLLWKKVAYGLSAGRVQSVAVRLIVERELARLQFKKSAYWGVLAQLEKDAISFESRLIAYQNKRIATGKDFNPDTGLLNSKELTQLDETAARKIIEAVKALPFTVKEVEEKPVSRRPATPFITSTLQQEANRKMGFGSRETMQVAQKLYEQGFITYMRTDSTFLSKEAIDAARKCIQKKYGSEYLPPQPRLYEGKKVKGAQEAHEAIRPAGQTFVDPDETGLSGQQLRLYELIWKRTVASQMVDARQKQVSVKITAGEALFSSSGMTIEFPGFLRAYVEGSDDPDAELAEREVRLPGLKTQDKVASSKVDPTSHETKPPARFTEASLVQTMEKEGIGRPSTYASVIGTIIDRGYVRKNGTALVPTFTAMIVSKLLWQYFPQYVDLGFTSEMESSLDHIAEGDLNWEKYLKSIYWGPKGLKAQVTEQEEKIDPQEARTITLLGLERYKFHVGRYGAYVTKKLNETEEVSATVPDSESPGDMTSEQVEKLIEQKINGADALGKDEKTGLPVYVLSGRYGPYVQLGDATEEEKPKRASLPQGVQPADVTLPMALELLALPKKLGDHPDSGKEIKAGLGRFGPFVVHDGDFRSIPKHLNLFTITFLEALDLLMQPKKGRGRAAALKDLGVHPVAEEMIQIFNGPYGLYVKCGKVNASLPEGETADTMTMQKAIEVLEPKMAEMKQKKKAAGKKTASEKKAAGKKILKAADPLAKEQAKGKAKKKVKKAAAAPPAPPPAKAKVILKKKTKS